NAVTGGGATVEEHRRDGGKPDICPIFHHYAYFFEMDDEHLQEVNDTCRSGERLCGECKEELADKVLLFLEGHQARREEARDRLDDFLLKDGDLPELEPA
ncbi:MAG: tryptophan--tRNA ligase, partial [Thermoplasmata archaeon]